MSEILVVGSLCLRFNFSSPEGKVDKTLGGSANYFSLAAHHFAQRSRRGVLLAATTATKISTCLKSRNVDTEGLQSCGRQRLSIGKANMKVI
jgi:hypothetical protein